MAKRARPIQNGKKFSLLPLTCYVEDCEEDSFIIYPEPNHKRICKTHYFNPPQQTRAKATTTSEVLALLASLTTRKGAWSK